MKWTGNLLGIATALAFSTALNISGPVPAAESGKQRQSQSANQSQSDDIASQARSDKQDATPAPAQSQESDSGEQTSAQSQKGQKTDAGKEARQLKIFELKHRSPQELMQVMNAIRSGGSPGQYGYVAPGQQTLGFRGPEGDDLSIAVNDEKKLVFVRGSRQQIQKIEKMIQAIDVKAGQLKAEQFDDVHLIPVARDNYSHVQTTLNQLGLGGHMMLISDQSFVVFQAKEDNAEELKQVKEVIDRLSGQKSEASSEPDSESRGEASSDDAADETSTDSKEKPRQGSGQSGAENKPSENQGRRSANSGGSPGSQGGDSDDQRS